MHRAHDLAPRFGVEPVGKLGQPLVQFAPELNARGNRWRRLDRAQTRQKTRRFFPHFFSSCAIRSIAGFHNTCWSRMNAVTSSGDIERANDPRAASSFLTLAISSAARRASLALA